MNISFKRYDVIMYLSENIETTFNMFKVEDKLMEFQLYLSALALLLKDIEDINIKDDNYLESNFNLLMNKIIENESNYKKFLEENLLEGILGNNSFLLKYKDIEYKTPYDLKALLLSYMNFVTLLSNKLYENYDEIFKHIANEIKLSNFTNSTSYNQLFNKSYKITGFFSYAYLDKTYSLGIFILFLNHNTLLYLDWLFNNQINCGIKLKEHINSIMKECDFLLFLRTVNSEINSKGTHHIRQWCSWEIGNFYQYQNEKSLKFCIHTLGNNQNANILLDDFKIINSMNDYTDVYN